MKKHAFQEMKTKPREEIENLVKESRKELRTLTFDLAAGKVKNVRRIKEIKKDIARMLTALRERINDKR